MLVEDEILFFISATMDSHSSVVVSLTVTWVQAIYVGFLEHGVGDGIDDSPRSRVCPRTSACAGW